MTAIDLFAGAGGFTTGAELAGVHVLWAGNHWPAAVAIHAANHPGAQHLCQDLHQADWSQVPAHDILLASPACQGHSRARGKDRPHHDAARSTAWAVISAAEYHRPPMVLVENVPEFANWVLFGAWRAALEALGYAMAPHLVDAADHGVPQHRRRLFILATRSRSPLKLKLGRQPHVPAKVILDPEGGSWSVVNKPGRAAATLARIERGRRELGPRFLMGYYGSWKSGRSLDLPLGTITTLDRWALVDNDHMRMLTPAELRAGMGFPASYQLPPQRRLAIHLLGNAVVPPVAADILRAIRRAA
ncbi:MAG: DNA cytosine methyltransferase [bacterium]|nr:DNA cytosine methyltransferase [bacterium]